MRDDWMASPMQWMWTWANSRRWWGTGRPDMLQSMGSWRVRQDLVTDQKPLVSSLCALLFFLMFFAFGGQNELGAVFLLNLGLTFFFPHRASNEPLPFLVWTFHTLTHSPALFVLWHNYFFVVCIWRYFLQMQSLFYSPIWPVSWLWDMPFHP